VRGKKGVRISVGVGFFLIALTCFTSWRDSRAQTVSSWTMAVGIQDQITLDLAAYSQLKPCTVTLSCAQQWRLCNTTSQKANSSCVTVSRGSNLLELVVDQTPTGGTKVSTPVAALSVQMPAQ
jgi:hypothetical protein